VVHRDDVITLLAGRHIEQIIDKADKCVAGWR
jgi:hypothetical protein